MSEVDKQNPAGSLAIAAPPGQYRDYYAGGLMIVLGLYAASQGMHYGVGSLTRMGPGFFPMSIGLILASVGVVIALGQYLKRARSLAPQFGEVDTSAARRPPFSLRHWRNSCRAPACMILSVVAFIVVGRHGGLLPASFAVVFIAAMGDAKNGWRQALALALCICVLCVIVFWWALQVEMPLFVWGG